jgi:hypothetical protein
MEVGPTPNPGGWPHDLAANLAAGRLAYGCIPGGTHPAVVHSAALAAFWASWNAASASARARAA